MNKLGYFGRHKLTLSESLYADKQKQNKKKMDEDEKIRVSINDIAKLFKVNPDIINIYKKDDKIEWYPGMVTIYMHQIAEAMNIDEDKIIII